MKLRNIALSLLVLTSTFNAFAEQSPLKYPYYEEQISSMQNDFRNEMMEETNFKLSHTAFLLDKDILNYSTIAEAVEGEVMEGVQYTKVLLGGSIGEKVIKNVRELINRIRRAVILCENGLIQTRDLELEPIQAKPLVPLGLKTIKNQVEKHALVSAIQKHDGKMDIVANDLQISRATLYRLIDKHEIYATE